MFSTMILATLRKKIDIVKIKVLGLLADFKCQSHPSPYEQSRFPLSHLLPNSLHSFIPNT